MREQQHERHFTPSFTAAVAAEIVVVLMIFMSAAVIVNMHALFGVLFR